MTTYKLTHEGYVIRDGDTKVPTVDTPEWPNTNADYLAYKQWLADGGVPLPPDPLSPQETFSAVQQAVQQRLDDFAQTRGYDGILSAATYVTSTVPKFAAEGQYAVGVRDATWAACYQIMADVQSGVRPLPTVSEVLAELPPLEWPQ
ncbi:MAG: hypothetical protein WC322_00235 [Candidatus Paceibacterota bacterium]|jgi:hypothetical protein